MKLTIERGDLLGALSHVQNVVERRNTIPILSNILLTAKDGQLIEMLGRIGACGEIVSHAFDRIHD